MSTRDDCQLCGLKELRSGEYEYSDVHGLVCLPCMRREHPDHISIGNEWRTRDEDLDVIIHDDRRIVIHRVSGIAAMGANLEAAIRLLRKVMSDVTTVERNERYGVCME